MKKKTRKKNLFKFGKNWQKFIKTVNEEKIKDAENALSSMVDVRGKTFLDIGCGSGLMSLAARRLGAKVFSFDNDPLCVECARELRKAYWNSYNWTIDQGNVLDMNYVCSLGKFDVVYAWGVLHHTGDMWRAFRMIPILATDTVFVAVYNDQGIRSMVWNFFKEFYCSSWFGKTICTAVFFPLFYLNSLRKKKKRGMSVYYDIVDWLGGYPYEVAAPDRVITFFKCSGFELKKIIKTKGLGNNQYVFSKMVR